MSCLNIIFSFFFKMAVVLEKCLPTLLSQKLTQVDTKVPKQFQQAQFSLPCPSPALGLRVVLDAPDCEGLC